MTFDKLLEKLRASDGLGDLDASVTESALQSIRGEFEANENTFDRYHAICARIGATENLHLRRLLMRLRDEFEVQTLVEQTAEIGRSFALSAEDGWKAWLSALAEAVSRFRHRIAIRLVEHAFPFDASRQQQVKDFRRATECMLQNRWAEVYDEVAWLSNQEAVSAAIRARLIGITGQIDLYHFANSRQAKRLFEEAARIAPDDGWVIASLADYWLGERNVETAASLYERAIELAPKLSNAYVGMGDRCEKDRRFDEAEAWYRKAIALAGGDTLGHARLLALIGRPETLAARVSEFLPLLDRARAVDPEVEYDLYLDAARYYLDAGSVSEARKWNEKAIELQSDWPRGYADLAEFCRMQGSLDEAETFGKKAIDVAPECPSGYLVLRSVYEDQSRWADALNVYQSFPPRPRQWVHFARASIERMRAKLGKLDSGKKLLELARTTEAVELALSKLSQYASLKGDQDTRVSKYQGYNQQMQSLFTDYGTAVAWVQPALVAIPRKNVEAWMKSSKELAVYRHSYDNLWRQQKHVLSEKEEKLLSLAGDMSSTPGDVYSQMMNADLSFGSYKNEKGESVEMTQARYSVAMTNPDRKVRKAAWDVYYQGYENYLHAAAESYTGAVKRDMFYAKARGYESCAQAALDADNVPVDVLDNLIETVGKNTSAVRRYHGIRRAIMQVDTLQHWDTYVALIPALDEEIPYEKAVETIEKGLEPLGAKYVEDMTKGFASRWIDVYENVGKRSGAYSSGTAAAPHPYMLLNYESRMDDMFTLAHEMGHSMHTFYSVANQPQVYSDYSIFVAEVASTTNEAILMHSLLGQPMDRTRKIFLLNQYIEKILGTVYTQVMFSEFEKRTHEMAERGEPLTLDALNAVYLELIDKYSGGAIHYGPRSGEGWCRIGHFYRNFYVYKYATSYAAATALAQGIVDEKAGARDAYLTFLASGSSDYPIDLLKKAGVDLSTPAAVQATCDLLSKLVGELDELVAQ